VLASGSAAAAIVVASEQECYGGDRGWRAGALRASDRDGLGRLACVGIFFYMACVGWVLVGGLYRLKNRTVRGDGCSAPSNIETMWYVG
jgi:hypothetical protein